MDLIIYLNKLHLKGIDKIVGLSSIFTKICIFCSYIFGGFSMKVKIDQGCIACCFCCEMCPKVFRMGDNGAQVMLDTVPDGCNDKIDAAIEYCPVNVISLVD